MSRFSDSETLAPYRPGDDGPWHGRHAYHLMERAGFGGTPEDVRLLSEHGMDASVDFLLRSPAASLLKAPSWAASWEATRYRGTSGLSEDEKRAFRNQRDGHMRDLQREWLDRMMHGPQPFVEKLTLFFHSHFAVSAEKVKDPLMVHTHLNLFRAQGGSDFRDLVKQVCKDPAMVIFLDSASNVKGRPNENFARELMELHTLGEGQGYTEQDIQEAARALTGWSVKRFEAAFDPGSHDDGSKTFMRKQGPFGVDEIVDLIFDTPEASRFLAVKLFRFFVYEDPSDALCDELAAQFKAVNYNVRDFLSTVFRSKAFYSAKALRSLIKSPIQLVVGTCRKLSFKPEPSLDSALEAARLMGQHLLWPPDVDGWKEGDVWINTNNLMMRYQWLHYLTTGDVPEGLKRVVKDNDEDSRSFVDVEPYLDPVRPEDADGAVDKAALRLFGRLLDENRKQEMIEYLKRGSNNAPVLFDLTKSTSEERFRGILYLMMSSPDYHLF